MPSRRTVLGLSSVTAIATTAGCLRAVRDQFESNPDVLLERIVLANLTETDRSAELVVVRDGEVDLWQTFDIEEKEGQTFDSQRIPVDELGEPVEAYEIGANVANVDTRWFDLDDAVPESTIDRCQEADESIQFYVEIRSDKWIGSIAFCE